MKKYRMSDNVELLSDTALKKHKLHGRQRERCSSHQLASAQRCLALTASALLTGVKKTDETLTILLTSPSLF